jgi:hypothetical protein
VKAAPRLLIALRPSRWQARVSWIVCILAAVTLAYVLTRLGCAPMLAYLCAALFGVALSYQQLTSSRGNLTQLTLGDGGVWIQNQAADSPKVDSPKVDSPSADLPQLKNMRCYLGLIYLRNAAARDVLIWPDSLSAEEHRQLRVWLGIHARIY